MTKVNDFAEAINGGDIVSFGSIHPDSQNVFEELERIKAMGLKGVKLHPDYQGFFVDDEKVFPIYEECEALNLPITFHAGCDLGFGPPVHATPDRLRNVLDMFPKLKVIAAHFGGYKCWDMADYFLIGKNIYFDTSFTANEIDPIRMRDMIKKHGVDKILFASDCPWKKMSDSIVQIEKTGLPTADTDKIFYQNALELLNS